MPAKFMIGPEQAKAVIASVLYTGRKKGYASRDIARSMLKFVVRLALYYDINIGDDVQICYFERGELRAVTLEDYREGH